MCDDNLCNTQTAEVCFSVSHAGRDSPSSAKFDPEPNRLLCSNRLLYCVVASRHRRPYGRLCRNAASFGSRQSSTLLLVWFCESKSLTTSQPWFEMSFSGLEEVSASSSNFPS